MLKGHLGILFWLNKLFSKFFKRLNFSICNWDFKSYKGYLTASTDNQAILNVNFVQRIIYSVKKNHQNITLRPLDLP